MAKVLDNRASAPEAGVRQFYQRFSEEGMAMGVVHMEVVDSFHYQGTTWVKYAVYVYCDNCGSFNIRKCLSLRQRLLILSGLVLMALVIYLKLAPAIWVVLLCFFPMIGILVSGFWGLPAYKCGKCGQFTTIRYNTRDYPSDKSIVDVPDQLIRKFGLEGWPQAQTIEDYLHPPEKPRHNE